MAKSKFTIHVEKINEQLKKFNAELEVTAEELALLYDKVGLSKEARSLPGMSTEVYCPSCIGFGMTLHGAIQHLNDFHKWTREEIADWLDALHDAGMVDIEFEPWSTQ